MSRLLQRLKRWWTARWYRCGHCRSIGVKPLCEAGWDWKRHRREVEECPRRQAGREEGGEG